MACSRLRLGRAVGAWVSAPQQQQRVACSGAHSSGPGHAAQLTSGRAGGCHAAGLLQVLKLLHDSTSALHKLSALTWSGLQMR